MFQGIVSRGAGVSVCEAGNLPLTSSNSRKLVALLRSLLPSGLAGSALISPFWLPFGLRLIRYLITFRRSAHRSIVKVNRLSKTANHLNFHGWYQRAGK